jgi:hypothetical protein
VAKAEQSEALLRSEATHAKLSELEERARVLVNTQVWEALAPLVKRRHVLKAQLPAAVRAEEDVRARVDAAMYQLTAAIEQLSLPIVAAKEQIEKLHHDEQLAVLKKERK